MQITSQIYTLSHRDKTINVKSDVVPAAIGRTFSSSMQGYAYNFNELNHYEQIVDIQYYDEIPLTPQKRLAMTADPNELSQYDYIIDSQYDEIPSTSTYANDRHKENDWTRACNLDIITSNIDTYSTVDQIGPSTADLSDKNYYYELVIENQYHKISPRAKKHNDKIGTFGLFTERLGLLKQHMNEITNKDNYNR